MDEQLPEAPPLEHGVYRHYKGNQYLVIGLACHSETLEWYVVYEPLYDQKSMPERWVRPYEMFIGEVTIDGQKVKRFTHIAQ